MLHPLSLLRLSLRLLGIFLAYILLTKAKYPDAEEFVEIIESAGGIVLFGVDATKLLQHKNIGTYDVIVFNFPHTGSMGLVALSLVYQSCLIILPLCSTIPFVLIPPILSLPLCSTEGLGIKDQARNIEKNQALIRGFLAAAASRLCTDGLSCHFDIAL